MPWYKTGTVSVVQNSNAVIGAGTAFISNSRVGDAFRGPDGGWYEVINIASDTALSISPPYKGATAGGGSYALAPMQGYVKDSADALRALVNNFGDLIASIPSKQPLSVKLTDLAGASSVANLVTLANAGYAPVQMGTGPGQTGNQVKIGWTTGGFLRAAVDSTDLGQLYTEYTVGTTPWIPATLQNGWSVVAGYRAVYRIVLGHIECQFYISGGTTANGTLLWTMPVGYRPAAPVVVPVRSIPVSGQASPSIFLAADGSVTTSNIAGSIAGSFWIPLS